MANKIACELCFTVVCFVLIVVTIMVWLLYQKDEKHVIDYGGYNISVK